MHDSITTLVHDVFDTTLRIRSDPAKKAVFLEISVSAMFNKRIEITPTIALALAGHLEFAAHDADPDAALKAWARGPAKPGT